MERIKAMNYPIIRSIVYNVIKSMMFFFNTVFGIEKKIVFNSFGGKQYSDNPRAISEKMHELYPDYKIVWGCNNPKLNPYGLRPNYVQPIRTKTLRWFYEIATSFCYVENDSFQPAYYKSPNQFWIQTWHGDRGFKKILYESIEAKGLKNFRPIVEDKVADLCIAGSKYGTEIYYRKSFRYNGEIMCVGSPRNDKLLRISLKDKISLKNSIGVDLDAKILLYAPTYRQGTKSDLQNSNVDLKEVLRVLQSKGEKWICFIRSHTESKGIDIETDGKSFLDVTDYPDMADLLCISDMLITDYSSCAEDFILVEKPIILTIFDIEEYVKNSRSFAFPIEKCGHIFAHNQDELIGILNTVSDREYAESCKKVMSFYEVNETGEASYCVCRRIDEEYRKMKKTH